MWEAVKFASLWASKDLAQIMEDKIFLVLFDMDLHTVVNQRLWLSPALFQEFGDIANFKANFHIVSLHMKKALGKVWHQLPCLVSEGDILMVISKWSSNCITPTTVKVNKKSRMSVQVEKSIAKKDTKKVPLMVTIDLEGKTMELAVEQETGQGEQGGGDLDVDIGEIDSTFIIKKLKKQSVGSARKKQK